MNLTDINGTIKPPVGYALDNLIVEGAYLILSYSQTVYFTGTVRVKGHDRVLIYVNNGGREVLRTADFVRELEQTMDWSMNDIAMQSGHQPSASWWEYLKLAWRRLS